MNILSETGEKLKATHARELVAAFFGYKSHAAVLAEKSYPLYELEGADVLAVDTAFMDERRLSLEGLPASLSASRDIAEKLVNFLERENHFFGKIWWIYDTLPEYVRGNYLPEHDDVIIDDLGGIMAETNAYFDEVYYDGVEAHDEGERVVIIASGQCNGTTHEDKPFSGDQIDMQVTVELWRVAGRNAYSKPHIKAVGDVNWDWVDIDDLQLERGA